VRLIGAIEIGVVLVAATISDPRERLALALDVDDLVAALRLARRMRPWFGVAKVGLELFSAAGPETVYALVVEGYRVFVDLKLHDIPTTVGRAARVLGGLGAAYVTVHSSGGEAMMRAAVEGMEQGASGAGAPAPCVLGVTLLTSEAERPAELLAARATSTLASGCGGIVCAAGDLALLGALPEQARARLAGLVKVVPGIRLDGDHRHDQAAAATPREALAAGADLLVVGRSVTAAADPEPVAAKLLAAVRDPG
jgi:orotidine-5'-phosphate decarboxylase